MPAVNLAGALRHEHDKGLAEQFVLPVAEQRFGLRVDERNIPLAVHHDHAIWHGLN